MADQDNPRLAELRQAIFQRLRPICSAMPEADFDALVRRIAEVEYRHEIGDRFRSPSSLPVEQQHLSDDQSRLRRRSGEPGGTGESG